MSPNWRSKAAAGPDSSNSSRTSMAAGGSLAVSNFTGPHLLPSSQLRIAPSASPNAATETLISTTAMTMNPTMCDHEHVIAKKPGSPVDCYNRFTGCNCTEILPPKSRAACAGDNLRGRLTAQLACGCRPGTWWLKAMGIEWCMADLNGVTEAQ